MGKVVLDNKFWLMVLAPIVGAFFAPEVHGVQESLWHVLKVAFYSFLVFYVYYFLLGFLKFPRFVRGAQNFMLGFSLILAFIDLFASHYCQMAFTPSLVGTILSTNLKESTEFFESVGKPHLGFVGLYWGVCMAFLYFVRLQVALTPPQSLKTFGVLFGIFWAHNIGAFYVKGWHGKLINPNIAMHTIPVVKEIYAFGATLTEYKQTKTIYTSLKQPLVKDYLSVDTDSVPNVVLIVGESASRDFMGVYGYPVQNTPFLSGLIREREREGNFAYPTA
ncbi:sulfatase-like hydrolase/transferase [Helicobacter ailurogastricus]|uniref:sulfatase-like hydrolase/transferase n=1 Tax=Helicobacter ailurogastricus TaxID=1578720 RepID=UPI000CF07C30|nr:sulfatase-like hydrolase/transferase [Helicobacter ailurogastricus]